MSPQASDKVRQQARPVPEPGVRAQNAVRRGPGSGTRVLLTIATALATSFSGTSGPAFAEADQDLWWPWLGQEAKSKTRARPQEFDLTSVASEMSGVTAMGFDLTWQVRPEDVWDEEDP